MTQRTTAATPDTQGGSGRASRNSQPWLYRARGQADVPLAADIVEDVPRIDTMSIPNPSTGRRIQMVVNDRQRRLVVTGLLCSLAALLLSLVAVVVAGLECGSLRRLLHGWGLACETTAVSLVVTLFVGVLVLPSWATCRKTRPGQPRQGGRWVIVRGVAGVPLAALCLLSLAAAILMALVSRQGLEQIVFVVFAGVASLELVAELLFAMAGLKAWVSRGSGHGG